jgi:hypothetical protein
LRAVSNRVNVPELEYPPPPDDVVYLLNWFYDVKQAKGQRISYTELNNYSSMLDLSIQPEEVRAVMMIDRIFEASVHG